MKFATNLALAKFLSNQNIKIADYKNMPVITHNSNQAEVIIHSASDNGFGLANIEVCFDRNNKKHSIDFNNLLKRLPANS